MTLKISLVQLYSTSQSPSSSPFAIEVLGGHVRTEASQWAVSLSTVSSRLEGTLEEYLDEAAEERFDVVGLSVAQGTYDLSIRLIEGIRRRRPDGWTPLIVLGSTLPTNRPQSFLRHFPELLIVRGFGEEALVEILRRFEEEAVRSDGPKGVEAYAEIPGIVIRRPQGLHLAPVVWPKRYSLPTWVAPDRYFARIEASRGCHYDRCTFCTRPPRAADQARWVRFPPARVVETIKRLKEEGVDRFTFTDEDFIGNDLDGCFEIADRLREAGGAPDFSFSTRADNVYDARASQSDNDRRRQLYERLQEVGLTLVFVGTESFCDSQLKRYGKSATAEGNIRALLTLQELGLSCEAGLITFDPFMTVDDIQENIDNLERHDLWKLTTHTLIRLRVQENTPFRRWIDREGLIGDYDENLMTYDYRFRDPDVAKIARICSRWKDETDYVYRLLRNAQRMALHDAFPNDAVQQAKEMNFTFLKRVVAAFRADPESVADVVTQMEAERYEAIEGMMRAADSPKVHLSMSDELRKEISGFLEVRG